MYDKFRLVFLGDVRLSYMKQVYAYVYVYFTIQNFNTLIHHIYY
jgi:hypothetical protein